MIGEMVKLIGMPTEDDLKAMGAEDMSVLETKQVKKASEAYTNKKDKNIRTVSCTFSIKNHLRFTATIF